MALTPQQIEDVKQAVATLRAGGLILYPTDTVWGIGCDATNAEAVARVYALKGRADNKALITLVDGLPMLERTVRGIPDVAYELIEFSDRPTTIVYDGAMGVAPNLLGEDGSIGVRVTHEAISSAIIRGLRRPLVSTSANLSGQPTPLCFSQITRQVLDAVDYVCTSRRDDCRPAKPSMVIRLSEDSTFKILRK